MAANGYGVSLGGDKNVLKLMVVMQHKSMNILRMTKLYILNG